MKPVRNAPSALPTSLRFIASRLAHRAKVSRQASGQFGPDLSSVVAALSSLSEHVLRFDKIVVSAKQADWLDAELNLSEGTAMTLIANGKVFASRPLDVAFGPQVGLWYRIGSGAASKMVGHASTFLVESGGRLDLVAKPPGEFLDRDGTFDPQEKRRGLSGEFAVIIIQWRGDPVPALQAAAQAHPDLFSEALSRLQQPRHPPQGWHYLWRLGQGEIFSPGAHDKREVCCHTRSDVGILQFPMDVPLTPETTVNWSWMVEQLPSRLAEHTEPTHDYLSLAVEFDNGLDLTWMWSAGLPIDTIFQCPLAWWKHRETHWVIRNDPRELGQWLEESRNLSQDYEKAIGGGMPRRIVAVWLIANTIFQRGEGKCQYRNIRLLDGDAEYPVAQA